MADIQDENAVERSDRAQQNRSDEISRDIARLVRAWTEAYAEFWAGTITVTGDLMVELVDAALLPTEEKRDKDDDHPHPKSLRRRIVDMVGDMTHSVARASNESAKVITEAAKGFTRQYETETTSDRGRDKTGQPPRPGAGGRLPGDSAT